MQKSQTTNFTNLMSNNSAHQKQLKQSASLNHISAYLLSSNQSQNQQNCYSSLIHNENESQAYNNQPYRDYRTSDLDLNDTNNHNQYQNQYDSNANTLKIKPIARIPLSASTGKYLYYINLFHSDSKWPKNSTESPGIAILPDFNG